MCSKLHHPNIVTLYGVSIHEPYIDLVMEVPSQERRGEGETRYLSILQCNVSLVAVPCAPRVALPTAALQDGQLLRHPALGHGALTEAAPPDGLSGHDPTVPQRSGPGW